MIRLTSGSWKDVMIEADQRRQRRWILVGNNFVQQFLVSLLHQLLYIWPI